MLTVGSSTESAGKATTDAGSQIVSDILSLSIPVIQTIEPASASDTSTLSKPSYPITCRTFPFLVSPSLFITTT